MWPLKDFDEFGFQTRNETWQWTNGGWYFNKSKTFSFNFALEILQRSRLLRWVVCTVHPKFGGFPLQHGKSYTTNPRNLVVDCG